MRVFLMTMRAALRALRRNKMRSALTTLGIVIGVAAVIAMVSIGRGANYAVQQQIASLGTNMLMVIPGATTAGGARSGWGGMSTLTVRDAEAIRADANAVAEVTWFKRSIAQVVYGDQNWSTSVQGATPTYLAVRQWTVAKGAFFTQRDEDTANRVVVLGQTVVDNLFGVGEDPIDATIRLKDVPFRVIGVLEAKGQTTWGQDQDDVAIIPFSTAERRVLGTEILGSVDMIFASAVSKGELESAKDQITELLRERHRIRPGADADFFIFTQQEMASSAAETSKVMTLLLASIAAVSLLVGGIGIMNIMLVSVTERTREIGIRRAIGARRRDIMMQFLAESAFLSLAGGALGVALGIGAATAVSQFARWPTMIQPAAVALAFGFSTAIGLFFGYYPALRAAALDPVEALRYE